MAAQEWAEHPATKQLRDQLREEVSSLEKGWKSGNFTGPTVDETAQLSAEAIGMVQAYEKILGMIDSIIKEDEEEEHDN